MHPIVEITIDGQPVAGAFYERLINVSVTDKEGIESDTFDMELNDGPEVGFLAIPRTGAKVDIRIGYGAPASLGQFVVTKVTGKCIPYGLSISGKSEDLGGSKLKEKKDKHWDNKSVKDIVDDIAKDSGLSANVDSEIGAHQYEWFGQQDESPIHVLRRLEQRHNGLFKVKDGQLIFSARGSGNSAGGSFMGSCVVTPSMIIQGTCTFEANDRTKYSKVVAYHQDKNKAERVAVEAEGNSDGEAEYRIPEPFSSVEEADKAAQSKAKDLKRGEGSASVTIVGNPGVTAGAPLLFSGVRPGLDGVPYIIDTATHTYSKGEGYRTQISAKLYDGSSGGSSDSEGGDDAASNNNSTTGDTVAADAPANTPATPSSWSGSNRLNSTDAN
jgi:phage protein D